MTRCGLQVAGRGNTTTSLGAVTCKRCVQYVELDRMVTATRDEALTAASWRDVLTPFLHFHL